MLTAQDNLHPDTNADIAITGICQNPPPQAEASCWIPNLDIPVLFQTQLPGRITLTGSFARLATSSLDPQTIATRGGAAYLAHLPQQQTVFQGGVPLQRRAKRLNHINSSFLAQEEDSRNAETIPAHPER